MALSGGPDSTALLHLLLDVADSLQLKLVAAHFDHGLRPESAREAAVVRNYARSLDILSHVGRPSSPLRTTQADLRAARYRWLEEVRRAEGADRVALGHHADDQAETVLFHIMRGSDLKGLTGMPARRGALVRPLMPFRRASIMSYLRARDIPWTDDPSNSDRRWVRARIRTDVIPGLECAGEDVVTRLLALSDAASRAEALLERAALELLERAAVADSASDRSGSWIQLERDVLLRAHPELRARVLRAVAQSLSTDLTAGGTRVGVEFMSEGRSGGRVDVGRGLAVSRSYDRIVLSPIGRPEPARPLIVPCEDAGGGTLRIGGRSWGVRWRSVHPGQRARGRIAVAVPRGHYPLRLREWWPGDRIRLTGGTRKLKKLFNDRRVPVGERHRVPVLVDSADRVLWVAGVGVAAPEDDVAYEEFLLELELVDE